MFYLADQLVPPGGRSFEFVECKGRGHPDSVTDAIADEISRRYSRFTLAKFGRLCNHWVDKCVLIGGQSVFGFGESRMISPMRLLVIGKATTCFEGVSIPIRDLARASAQKVLSDIIGNFHPDDLEVEVLTNDYQGAGRPASWYRPQGPSAMPPPTANDAVICSSFYPFSPTEVLTAALAELFLRPEVRSAFPYVGTDIKTLVHRNLKHLDITACVPFIASLTKSRAFYAASLDKVRSRIAAEIERLTAPRFTYELHLNTRDDAETVYMSHYGSCLDTGDVGAVGRGNRGSGLITPARPMSIEAPAGKNPRYHSGKIRDIAASNVAKAVHTATGRDTEVTISTQTGRPLSTPKAVVVHVSGVRDATLERQSEAIVVSQFDRIESLTLEFIGDVGTA